MTTTRRATIPTVFHPYLFSPLSILLLLPILLLAGCERTVAIRDLTSHPEQYENRDLRIQGRVVATFSIPTLTDRGFYILSDGTGQMGVIAKNPPEHNSQVRVTGRTKKLLEIALPAIQRFKVSDLVFMESERVVLENGAGDSRGAK